MTVADTDEKWMSSLRPSELVEIALQEDVSCFVEIKARYARKFNSFDLL